MKLIKTTLYIFIGLFILNSCDKLDLAPEDYFGSGSYWKTESQVQGNMVGLLSDIRGKYTILEYLGEMRGGTHRIGSSSLGTSLNNTNIKENSLSEDKPGISNWAGLYSNIFKVNNFIKEVGTNCSFLSDESRSNYLAQAYGIRAYYYFILYRTYGSVPLEKTPKLLEDGKVSAKNFYTKRAPAEEVLEFIKNDIKLSEDNYKKTGASVNQNTNKSHWSMAATMMLKAEVYLWSGKVSIEGHEASGESDVRIAKQALNEIIGKFQLQNDFSQIFDNAHKKNNELIFTLHFQDGEATNWGAMFLYQHAVFVGQVYNSEGKLIETDVLNLQGRGGVFRHEYKYELWKSFDKEDTRRDATFLAYWGDADKSIDKFGCCMKKGIGSINAQDNRIFDSDIIVYRYADAILMMAEAKNFLGEDCADEINLIRKRAYGDNFSGHEYTNGSFEENELAILAERDKEFVWEGKRWFDVVRMHDASHNSLAFSNKCSYSDDPLLLPSQKFMLLWPVDKGTLSNNKALTQTKGYKTSIGE